MHTVQVSSFERADDAATRAAWQPPHYVRSLSLAIPAVMLGFQISGWVFAMLALGQGRVDFRAMYTAGYMLRSGNAHLLYNYDAQLFFQNRLTIARDMTLPFDHMPYEALFYVPFSLLGFEAAYFAMLAINLAVLAFCVILIPRWTHTLDSIYPWVSATLMFTFLPTAVALMQGQDSIFVLLCLTAAFVASERGHEILAGVFLSLALFKFQIVLPIAFLFLLWRRWRFVAGFSFSTVALLVVSITLVGSSAMSSYFHLLLAMSAGLRSTADQLRLAIPPTGMANLRGFIFCSLHNYLPQGWIQASIIVLSAVCVIATWIAGSKTRKGASLLLAITAAAIVSYHFNFHDMTILLLPILVALDQSIVALPRGSNFGKRIAAGSALLFAAPLLFCFASGYFYLAALVVCGFLWVLLDGVRHSTKLVSM